MTPIRLCCIATLLLCGSPSLRAQDLDGGKAFAERSMQAYLEMWDRGVTPASVQRFYAPQVIYYGKRMTRAQVYADKVAFVRNWPARRYRQVPGSFAGTCNADRSSCDISVVITWSRANRAGHLATGRARLRLTFVPVDGSRKIVQESARIL